ncbi:MAG: hypothetical protein ACXABY_20240, partial [Candidatus Thorarchaeota archaeon]
MTQEVQGQDTVTDTAPAAQPTETLDSIAGEFQEAQPQGQSSEGAPPSGEPSGSPDEGNDVPDPVTRTDEFKKYLSGQSNEVKGIRAELRETIDLLKGAAQKEARASEEKAIQGITKEIAEEIGEGTNQKLVEAALGLKYRDDLNFKKIWNNRDQNPEAFNRAMAIVSNEIKGMFNRTVDPQVQENIRAMEKSTNKSTNRSKAPDAPEDRFRG